MIAELLDALVLCLTITSLPIVLLAGMIHHRHTEMVIDAWQGDDDPR